MQKILKICKNIRKILRFRKKYKILKKSYNFGEKVKILKKLIFLMKVFYFEASLSSGKPAILFSIILVFLVPTASAQSLVCPKKNLLQNKRLSSKK